MSQTAPIDPVTNWQARLRSRIFEQFQGLPNIQAVSDAIAAQAQDLEDAAQSILTITSVLDSCGVQLQKLGQLVGQQPSGETDPVYRLRIAARIAANRAGGDPEDLYRVFNAMFGLTSPGQAQVVPYPPSPAVVVFRVLGFPLDPQTAGVLFALLSDAMLGGGRLILEWPSAAPAAAFTFADANHPIGGPGLGFNAGQLAGSLST